MIPEIETSRLLLRAHCLDASIEGVPELGWVLSPFAHGKGYATEATRAALSWGDQNLKPSRTVCLISPENTPSLRVAEKIGYRELKRASLKDQPTIIFERAHSPATG